MMVELETRRGARVRLRPEKVDVIIDLGDEAVGIVAGGCQTVIEGLTYEQVSEAVNRKVH